MTNVFDRYQVLKKEEINNLREVLEKVGGEWHFGEDYCGDEPHGGDFPCVTINTGEHAIDVKILAVSLVGNSFSFVAEDWECGEEIGNIDIVDFMYEQIQFIAEEIASNCEINAESKNDTFFPITSISRDDLEGIGFDTSDVDDSTMEQLAKRMANDYLEQLYWTSMELIAEYMGIPRKESEDEEK